ncbi:MAG: sigma-70 family RNA polymerase sigma factor [Phycisphaeraceae bacterium]
MSLPMDASDRRALVAEHWHRWQGSIRAYLVAAVSDYHDAEDLLSQVAVAVARDYEKYDPQTPFIRWSIAIARNRVLNYRRTKAMSKLVFTQDTLDTLAGAMPEEAPVEAATKAALDQCIAKLQARSQQALTLRYEQDLKPREIAPRLEMSATAVTTLLHRVHKSLEKCVKQALGTA